MRYPSLVGVLGICTTLLVAAGENGCTASSALPSPPPTGDVGGAGGATVAATGGSPDVSSGGVTATGGAPIATGGAAPCLTNQKCDNVCVDLSNDPTHCGDCSVACLPSQICSDGQCVCPTEIPDLCGARCVNLQTSTTDCGTCYNGCSPKRCIAGACGCAATDVTCGADGACFDPMNDDNHCGDPSTTDQATICSNKCGQYQKCISGQCTLSCSAFKGTSGAPLADCGGVCLDTTKDVDNCGQCGNSCPNHSMFTCSASQCVCGAPGATHCVDPTGADVCVNVQNDGRFCGDCNTKCEAGHQCVNGACVCSSTSIDCGGNCFDPASDVNHCGDCTTKCGLFELCTSSKCVLSCDQFTNSAGYFYKDCSGTCKDISADPANCGGCGAACGTGQSCTVGKCECDTGMSKCGSACVNEQTDSAHCGDCTTTCSASQSCIAGQCTCAGTLRACGQACVDDQNDAQNCGGCAKTCTPKQMCQGGTCRTSVIEVKSAIQPDPANLLQFSQLYINLSVCNTSGSSLPLSGYTLKYWYTEDGASATPQTAIDYNGGVSVTATASFLPNDALRTKATSVMVVTFGATTLTAGQCTNTMQLRVYGGATYTCCFGAQAGDYSYQAGTTLADNQNITAYNAQGLLIWGLEPALQ